MFLVLKCWFTYLSFLESPIDLEAERQRQREQLIQQFRPSMINLLNTKLDELGVKIDQERLSDNMYKMKREELRNNRAHKTGSISNFHLHRNEVEGHLEHRVSQTQLNYHVDNNGNLILKFSTKLKLFKVLPLQLLINVSSSNVRNDPCQVRHCKR